uniref:otogelin-like protein n=1 Tax=Oncorhynchus gorbuscha TaxID=8017 RepID=UPI001EAF171F|nr:otogelin-like protein [Oncorhynchus gorbuscha]
MSSEMNGPRRVKLFLLSWYSVLQLLTAQEAQSQLTETDGRLQRRANALRRKRDLLGEETFSPLLSEAALPRSVLHNYTARDASSEYCGCLNGGWCQEGGVCDCAQFQALGDRCQIIPNQGQDRDGICRSWGQYHYETFDGSYFYYPGTCSYILAQDCRSATPQYTVWVHNSRVCEGSVYSCPRALSLFFPNEEEIHISGYQVHQGGRRLILPQTIGGVFIERLADYLLVKSVFGFSLAWDGGSGVYLKMSEQHHGTPCGLCGNYNNLPNDDLTTARGVQTEEPAVFANSWSVDLPHERGCPLVDIDFAGPCHSESDMDDAIEKCSALLFFPFLSCHENIDPNPYVASCVSDLCVSDEEETFCRALVEYTRACSHVGYPVREWRDSFPSCNDGCEESFVHRDCISCCPPTCTFDKECLGTNLHCLDGCYCPDGLILQNGTCIAVSQCPCVYHGTSYTQGHTLEQGCSVCVCMGGVWNCTDNNCTAECSVVGDVFVTSFDGRMFLQPGACQYVLAKSRSGSRFTVTLQYTTCTKAQQQVCIQSVTVVLDEDVNHQVTLTREGEVLIGVNPAPALPYTGDVVEVRRLTSVFIQLRTLLGLRLQYDGRGGRVYLQLDSQWRSNTLGLCGTFNGNLRDDFLSPAGMIEGTPQLHANSWRVSSACSAPVNQPIIDPCEINQHNVFYASLCEVLLGSVFSPCHGYVSSSVYQQQCRYQACRCGNACLCTALAHYAYLCSKHNVTVNYRAHVSECGMVCLGGMLYQSCVSSCGGSCRSLSSGETCNHDDCAEGCGCSEGSYYDDIQQLCVQPSQCHCYSIGGVSQPGEVSFRSTGPCLCRNGRMECVPEEREPERGQCPEGKVFHSCSEPQRLHGFQGSLAWRGGVACELTCRNLMLNLTCPPTTPCIPGCVCPQGLVLHRGECYYPENCPCAWLGLEYLPGETVDTPCYRCVCHRGYFNCSHSPCPAVCTVYSDRHYHTFDGLEYDYHSECQVYLLKSIDGEVSIVAQNKDCYQSGIICMKMLVIHVGFTKIYFNDNSGQPSPSSVVGKGSEFELWSAGYYTAIHFPYQDLTILWDHKTTVHIRVGPHWKGLLSGLCGNFDSVTVNDMTTSSHMEVSNAQGFGDSWALGQCESDYVVKRACEGDLGRQPYAKRECALLYSDVFTPCHNVVDVSWFYMNCLTDTCNCNRGGDCECLCTSIAAYAHTCCQHGVTVVWRNPSVCPYDCEYYNQELGEGPFSVASAVFNATVFGVNRTSGSVFPLVREFVGGLPPPGLLFNFMITAGLQKDRTSRLPVISLESAERPNYFLVVSDRAGLRLEQWTRGEKFGRRASFLQHQGLFLPGHTSLELIGQPGVFLTLTRTSARAQRYDNSDNFKTSSSFTLEESSFVIPFRMMCEWRYHACASPCVRTCSDLAATRCHFLPPVEGCFPRCPKNMVLDEVTRRCVYTEDCVSLPPTPTPYAFVNQTTTTPTTTTTAPTTTTTAPTTTTTATTTITTALTTTTTPPYSYRVDECTELICFNGELLLHNSSLHCRYNTTPPRCSLLGMAVLTNTDPCCPLWQCPWPLSLSQNPSGGTSGLCFKKLNITTPSYRIIINRLDRKVSVNHIKARLPFSRQALSVEDTGSMYLITTPEGVNIQWYHSTGIMVLQYTAPSNTSAPTRGLCDLEGPHKLGAHLPAGQAVREVPGGEPDAITRMEHGSLTAVAIHLLLLVMDSKLEPHLLAGLRPVPGWCCDGNPADDLKLPNGTVVREVADLGLFLQAWRVHTSEDTEHTRRIGDNCTTGDCSTCLSMLRQRPFTPCHSKVSPEQFCDVMWAGDLHYKAHQCDFLAAYVAVCYTYQVCINWRRHNFCPLRCPPGREYQACVSICTTRTCQNREFYEETTCSHIREECVCRSGTILHRADSSYCVTEEQCVCTDNEGSPRAPGEVWNGSLRSCCLFRCLENGSVVAVEPDCSISPTLLCEREGEYVLDVLEEAACCPKQICECNLTICESEAPPCENGNQLVIGYSALSCCPEYRCECDPHACPPLTTPDCREDQFLVEVREDNSCCYSFLCVCESCIEPVPSCSYGEILAVDLNTTHSCCPQYHCVCDVNLCPESTLSCSPGLSLIQTTLPGHCCPDRHCECQCEDSPVCQVGEVQVEVADSRSTCGCPLYTCKKAEVCVFQGVTVLGPGQSLIQYYEGELCYTVHCLTHRDTHTGYYAMDVSAVNCSQKCGQHQLYVASSDPQVCCGSCKNVSCSFNNHNGTTELFAAGSSWVDNCTRYDCVETTVGTVMLASGVVCPPFNDTECTQNGGVVQSYVDGCCRMCKEDGKTCKRVAIRTTIRKDDCRSNAPVTVFSCDGKCPSATIFNFNINSHARFCKCCRESGLQTRSVTLYCSHNATLVVYSFQEPVDCSCQWN